MSDIIIRTTNLTKTYKLYAKPHHRFLDMFGLLRNPAGKYTKHTAVDHVDLEICRGEKLAIIGRNGAGKSTLLKLVTKTIEPTSGQIDIHGGVHALLQIGTGFHPDFTGRENVFAYLAHLGITGKRAGQLFEQIVDFAELEEYIDQPIKTYSTGMGVRLMFSTSTVMAPDILVLDEVLGVGDAYFAQKSFERMKSMCEQEGTTLLLVTHDLYSAASLCDRFIWIDKGRVLLEGAGTDVIHAYEQSIRDQEEARLRQRRLTALKQNTENRETSDQEPVIFAQICAKSREAPRQPIAISKIDIQQSGQSLAVLDMACQQDAVNLSLVLDEGEGNWSEPIVSDEGTVREFSVHGSIYHRAPFLIKGSQALEALRTGQLEMQLTLFDSAQQELILMAFDPQSQERFVGELRVSDSGNRQTIKTLLAPTTLKLASTNDNHGIIRYGSRALEITDVRFQDQDFNETQHFRVGNSMRVCLKYAVNDPDFNEAPTIIVAFQKDGVTRSHRFWTDQIRISADQGDSGTLEIYADPLLLGAGTYLVTISLFREGYFSSTGPKKFFSANPNVLDIHSRGYEIVVAPSENVLCNDVVFQHQAKWLLNGNESASTQIVRDRAA